MNKKPKKIDFTPYTSRICIYTHTTNKVNYWKNFNLLRQKYKIFISKLQDLAYTSDIHYIWLFFEPYLEITFLDKDQKYSTLFLDEIKKLANTYIQDISHITVIEPTLDNFGDWVGKTSEEKLFGCEIHTHAFNILNTFNEYEKSIDEGLGNKIQASRTIHRIFNPLCLNYKDEAKICFWRSIFCFMRYLGISQKKSVWIYTKIFRQTYYN